MIQQAPGRDAREKKPRRVSGAELVQRCHSRGDRVYYARKALLPALEVQVLLREVSREELGILERAVLALVHDGVGSLGALVSLIGIAPARLSSFLREFVQRGLLDVNGEGGFSLSVTGQMSLERGTEVVDVTRAVLLSGISGELLPTSAYSAQRFTPQELKRGNRYVLPEQPSIPTSALDLSKIAHKSSYNLPEEARDVLQIAAQPAPCFLECFMLVFMSAERRAMDAEVWFPDAKLHETPFDLLRPYLEPFGFEHRHGTEGALADVAQAFRGSGCTVSTAQLSALGTPELTLSLVDNRVLAWSCFGRPLAYFAGTAGQAAYPISEIQVASSGGSNWNRDIQGHSLALIVADETARVTIERCRRLHDCVDRHYADPTERRGREALLEAMSQVCPLSEAKILARQLADQRLSSQLESPAHARI